MDVSGGRGQPRPGNDESADRTGPQAPATDDALPDTGAHATPPAEPADGTAGAGHPAQDTDRTDHAVPTDRSPTPGPQEGTPHEADRPEAPAADPDPGPPTAPPAGPGDRSPTPGPQEGTPHEADRPEAPAADPGTPAGPGDRSPTPGPQEGTPHGADRREASAGGPDPDRPAAPPAGPGDRSPTPGPQEGTPHGADRPEAPAGGPDPGPPTAPPAGPPENRHHAHRTPAHSGGGKGPGPQRPEERQRGGLLMGRPFGVPVYVAPSWFLVAILITWVFGGQIDRVLPGLGAASYLVSLFFAVAFYASVLVHELAHTLAALRFKLPVRRIQLQFFGGVSEIEKEAETPGREFVLAFVGPLLSLALSGLFYLALLAVDPSSIPGVLLAGLMVSNLIVAVFNLLPGLPLDGGRMLRAVVWAITGKPMTGTVAAAWVGRALAVSVLIGLPLLTQSGALGSDAVDNVGMDTVLDALLAAILAAIIWTGAGNSLRMARLREHLPELRARTLTRRAVPVESDTPLSEALRRANAAGARALVVVDADGVPLSLVREAAIAGVPEHRRPWVPVSSLAQDLTDGMRVSAELAGEDLLDALRAAPATEYLVVEETGEIYGVLSAADVERAFVKAMARPS
ncbi:site-2 protease family protein [Streptomyces sp. NPDC093250]|uniref:site-2 protease family protein n=1 Tax=Streptomyces sp. NPDC093250 TaxID=3366036 RepID=UPI00381D7E64